MAAQLGFKLFISFDFAYWNNGDVGAIADYVRRYGALPAQLKVSDAGTGAGARIFVSTFVGDGFAWRAVEAQAGVPLFACPFWQPNSLKDNPKYSRPFALSVCLTGLQRRLRLHVERRTFSSFSWGGVDACWAVAVDQQPADRREQDDGRRRVLHADARRQAVHGPYVPRARPSLSPPDGAPAAVSPWFFTHYGADTWNKNWLFYSDYLWQARWEQILTLQPAFAQILTWNGALPPPLALLL